MMQTILHADTEDSIRLGGITAELNICYYAFDIFLKVVFCLALCTEEVNLQTFS